MITRLRSITFDQAVISLALVLLLLIGLVALIGTQAGVLVTADIAEASQNPFDPITLTFSIAVDEGDVESRFSLQPQADGHFEWLDDQTLRFVPLALQPDTAYELILNPGMIGTNDEPLRRTRRWRFKTRAPLIAYITSNPSNGEKELWAIDIDGKNPQPLIDTESSVFNFDVSPDGNFIILSMLSEEGRLNLWYADRDGQKLQKLLDCGGGNCTAPAISPDGRQVAYTREAPGITPDSPLSAPRIHILDLSNKQDIPLFSAPQIIGSTPIWSPDGKWITSYDSLQDIIRVVDIESGEQVLLPSELGNAMAWSPDSTRLAFTKVEENEAGLHTVVMLADFRSGDVASLIGRDDFSDYRYSSLAWSPTNERDLFLGLRPDPEKPPAGLWLIDPEVLGGRMLPQEENSSYNDPHWDPWGKAVVFQQFQLGTVYRSEIVVWERGIRAPQILAEGFSPRWLP